MGMMAERQNNRKQCELASAMRPQLTSVDLSNHLNLNASPQRNLRHAKRTAGVLASVTKYFSQQFAAPVGHQVMFGEVAGRVDQAREFDDALDFVQVTNGSVQRAHQVYGDRSRRRLAFFRGDVFAELADDDLAVSFGEMAAQEDQVAGLHERHIGGSRGGHGGQGNAQCFELVIDVLGVDTHGDVLGGEWWKS